MPDPNINALNADLREYLNEAKKSREAGVTLEAVLAVANGARAAALRTADRQLDHEKADDLLHAQEAREHASLDLRVKAIEVALGKVLSPSLAKPPSIPPPRTELPSILADDENDSPTQVRKKAHARATIEEHDRQTIEWAEAQRVEAAAALALERKRWQTIGRYALAAGLALSMLGVVAAVWAGFKYAVHEAAATQPAK